jgi:hypothetical protein
MSASERRLRVLSGHLAPAAEVELTSIARASTSASSSSTFASATGQPSSYARVHGEPSRAPAVWREIPSVAREQLEDVKYHKAVGEGIAKVGNLIVLDIDTDMCTGSRPAMSCLKAGIRSSQRLPHRPQITINRPEKRNAFRPRTGARGLSLGSASSWPRLQRVPCHAVTCLQGVRWVPRCAIRIGRVAVSGPPMQSNPPMKSTTSKPGSHGDVLVLLGRPRRPLNRRRHLDG